MKRWLISVSLLALLLATMAPLASAAVTTGRGVSAQDQGQTDKEKQEKAEADAYKAWYDARSNIPQALPLAKAYIEKFPNGQYASYLKTWINGARASMFNQAMQQKNTDEMIKIGNEVLTEDPNNLDYLYLLAFSIIQNELYASPPNFSHVDQETDYINRAIKLIDAGQQPKTIPPDKWNKSAVLGYLYQNLGHIEADSKKDQNKALEYYKQSYTVDPKNAASYLAAGTIHQAKYVAATQKYQAIPDADKNPPDASTPVKPEVKAALDDVNNEADAVIDAWAHFLALTASNNSYGKVRDDIAASLPKLYAYRHPESPDGLQKLIDQYKNGGTAAATPSQPASSAAASASKPSSGNA